MDALMPGTNILARIALAGCRLAHILNLVTRILGYYQIERTGNTP